MVGHNYIMQMTFAVLFELIPSDVSFFYHTLHTSVSPPWLCWLLLFWSPSSCAVCPDCQADTARCEDAAGVMPASDTGYVDSWSEQVYIQEKKRVAKLVEIQDSCLRGMENKALRTGVDEND